jgi:A/G-specific adenine glycosylase
MKEKGCPGGGAGRADCLAGRLLAWYRENARDLPWRADREPYHVWISEIMLQQTRVETARPYYTRFLSEAPGVRELAEMGEERLLKLWEGLGYYSRARNLQTAARVIMEKHGGRFPREFREILALPGVGAYTAGAIASICFDAPVPAVDGNVLRVAARVAGDASPVDRPEQRRKIEADLTALYAGGDCGDLTQSLMELGALICLPGAAAKCDCCPISALCAACRDGTAARLPVRAGKKARKKEEWTVFALFCGEAIALRKRRPEGLLASLWELPNIEGKRGAAEALALARDWGLGSVSIQEEKERLHVFTHVEWRMRCYFIRCERRSDRFLWADPRALDAEIALPSAFRKFLTAESR